MYATSEGLCAHCPVQVYWSEELRIYRSVGVGDHPDREFCDGVVSEDNRHSLPQD